MPPILPVVRPAWIALSRISTIAQASKEARLLWMHEGRDDADRASLAQTCVTGNLQPRWPLQANVAPLLAWNLQFPGQAQTRGLWLPAALSVFSAWKTAPAKKCCHPVGRDALFFDASMAPIGALQSNLKGIPRVAALRIHRLWPVRWPHLVLRWVLQSARWPCHPLSGKHPCPKVMHPKWSAPSWSHSSIARCCIYAWCIQLLRSETPAATPMHVWSAWSTRGCLAHGWARARLRKVPE